MRTIIIIGIICAISAIAYDQIVLEPARDRRRREKDAAWMKYVRGLKEGE